MRRLKGSVKWGGMALTLAGLDTPFLVSGYALTWGQAGVTGGGARE